MWLIVLASPAAPPAATPNATGRGLAACPFPCFTRCDMLKHYYGREGSYVPRYTHGKWVPYQPTAAASVAVDCTSVEGTPGYVPADPQGHPDELSGCKRLHASISTCVGSSLRAPSLTI